MPTIPCLPVSHTPFFCGDVDSIQNNLAYCLHTYSPITPLNVECFCRELSNGEKSPLVRSCPVTHPLQSSIIAIWFGDKKKTWDNSVLSALHLPILCIFETGSVTGTSLDFFVCTAQSLHADTSLTVQAHSPFLDFLQNGLPSLMSEWYIFFAVIMLSW